MESLDCERPLACLSLISFVEVANQLQQHDTHNFGYRNDDLRPR